MKKIREVDSATLARVMKGDTGLLIDKCTQWLSVASTVLGLSILSLLIAVIVLQVSKL